MRLAFAARLGLLGFLAACGGDDSRPHADAGSMRDRDARAMRDDDAGADRDADLPPPPPAPHVCSTDGFCWEAPLPQGEHLHAAWSASKTDAWLVGDHGVLLHYDGKSFSNVDAGTQKPLLAVHGSAADDVWAVGGGVVLHYDGSSWTSSDVSSLIDASAGAMTGTLYGVFAASHDSVWAVGYSGVRSVILHFDGETWTNQALSLMSDQALRSVWGVSGQRVWAVGDKGTILSFDGSQWTVDKSPTQAALYSVHALVEHDVWAVGANVAVRWNGTSWVNASTGLTGTLQSVRVDIAAPAPMDGGMAMMPPMMTAGTAAPQPPQGPWSVWGFAANGQVFRHNGTLWAELPSGTMRMHDGATRLASGLMLAVGAEGQIIRFEGDARQNMSQGERGNHLSLWNDGESVWAVGDDIERRIASGWQSMQRPSERSLYGVWGDSHGLWAVGTAGSVARYTDGAWKNVNVNAAGEAWLHAVAGAGQSVWIVGEGGLTLVSAAGSFIKVATPLKSNLLDVWGADDTNFWAVGEGGAVLRWDGMSWSKVPTGAMGGVVQNLRAVWGTSKDDLWVVGAESTILHWNGQRFESQSPGAKYTLNDIWGRAHDDVYAVGSGGVALHYDGESWKSLETGTTASLQSVIGDAHGRVFAAGLDGTILVREP